MKPFKRKHNQTPQYVQRQLEIDKLLDEAEDVMKRRRNNRKELLLRITKAEERQYSQKRVTSQTPEIAQDADKAVADNWFLARV